MTRVFAKGTPPFDEIKRQAHVQPRLDIWRTAANPVNVWYETLAESAEFIRFVNPGDLRVAEETCGACHAEETRNVGKSMMRHGGMLWGAATYNNGSFPFKNTQFGEFYTRDGQPAIANTTPQPTPETTAQNRRAAESGAAVPLAGVAAGQRPPHLRARWATAA